MINNDEQIDDINNIFENIFLTEENLSKEGYKEGWDKGVEGGNSEAYHLGYHRGVELGCELGYYSGIVEFYKSPSLFNDLSEKSKKNLDLLKSLIENFPKVNDETVDIFQLLTEIRDQFKKVCALLKISSKYPFSADLSF